jgi:pimeloyl-ACP methyl ester carboxylesterase
MDGGRTRERRNGVAAVQELSRASRCRRPDGHRPVHPAQDWWAPPGDVPYLVVQGLNDQAAPVENGHLLKQELGQRVTIVDVPNAGHLQPLEAPGPVAEAVIAFARRSSPQT